MSRKPSRALSTAIGQRVRQHRQRHGWTQEELAARAGVQTGYISRLETGSSSPTLAKLEVIATTLNTELAELIGGASARDVPTDEQRVLDLWQGLSNEQREAVMTVMRAMR